jgi:hypothetical protein
MLRFWGNFILAFFISPLVVAIIIFVGTTRKGERPPKPVPG